ncbi:hypothetical protein MMC06_003500 [Schaereria dolodes]|nr:hypothetical protein [Schaereria dolodes]
MPRNFLPLSILEIDLVLCTVLLLNVLDFLEQTALDPVVNLFFLPFQVTVDPAVSRSIVVISSAVLSLAKVWFLLILLVLFRFLFGSSRSAAAEVHANPSDSGPCPGCNNWVPTESDVLTWEIPSLRISTTTPHEERSTLEESTRLRLPSPPSTPPPRTPLPSPASTPPASPTSSATIVESSATHEGHSGIFDGLEGHGGHSSIFGNHGPPPVTPSRFAPQLFSEQLAPARDSGVFDVMGLSGRQSVLTRRRLSPGRPSLFSRGSHIEPQPFQSSLFGPQSVPSSLGSDSE